VIVQKNVLVYHCSNSVSFILHVDAMLKGIAPK